MMKFFEDRKRLCTFLFVLGFITSGIFTVLLLTSNSISDFSKGLAVSMTVVLEFGKGICFIESKRKDKYTAKMQGVLFGMWIFTTLLSIFASQAYLVNETNSTANSIKVASPEYVQLQDKALRLKEQIELKKDLLTKSTQDKTINVSNTEREKQNNLQLTAEYNKTIKSYQNQISAKNTELQNAINKKYVNTPSKIRNEIKQITDVLNNTITARDKLTVNDKSGADTANITQLDNEINKINNELNSIDYGSVKTDLPSNGYIALFQIVASFLGFKLSTVTFFFYLAVTVGFEILICLLYHIAVVHSNEVAAAPIRKESSSGNYSIGFKPSQVTAKNDKFDTTCYSEPYNFVENGDGEKSELPVRKIGFVLGDASPSEPTSKNNVLAASKDPLFNRGKVDLSKTATSCVPQKVHGIDNKMLSRYLTHIYDNIKVDNAIDGYQTCGKILKLTYDEVRKLKNHCEYLGILKSDSNSRKTFIIKNRNEISDLILP